MTQTLSEMLDVQPDDVEVSVDDDGAVTYVVSTGSQDDVKDLQDQISSDMFTTILDTQVAETSDQVYSEDVSSLYLKNREKDV